MLWVQSGKTNGFTIVELITVIILLGVLSTVAISRSVKPSSFEAAVVSGYLIEEFRFARRLAISRQDVDVSVTLTLVADTWQSAVRADGIIDLRARSMARSNGYLVNGGGDINTGDTLTIAFNRDGTLGAADVSGAALVVTSGFELDVIAENQRTICVYPTGYVTRNACV